jgi:uncharacterized membrane protein YkoI
MALVMVLPNASMAKEKASRDKIAMVNAAKVSIDQAIKTASEKVSGKVIEAELEKKHKKTVWEVDILTPDGTITEVHVDSDTGEIIDTETKKK